jgi:hypothetical protein
MFLASSIVSKKFSGDGNGRGRKALLGWAMANVVWMDEFTLTLTGVGKYCGIIICNAIIGERVMNLNGQKEELYSS